MPQPMPQPAFLQFLFTKKRPRFGTIRLDVQLLVYSVQCTVYTVYNVQCTYVQYTVYSVRCTVGTHMPNVYNFGAGTAVYRTAVPHECTMHGGIRYPDLDLE
jgi:hypothetical protein